VAAADRLSTTLGKDVLLILAYDASLPSRFQRVGRFEGKLILSETFEIYLLEHGTH